MSESIALQKASRHIPIKKGKDILAFSAKGLAFKSRGFVVIVQGIGEASPGILHSVTAVLQKK